MRNSLILPLFSDPYPRVRYAACQCVGQLCIDLEEVIQAEYHQQLFSILIPTLEATESRVHAHTAAAHINFCEDVERETLIPYLDPIVERLLKLLNPAGLSSANADANGAGNENGTGVREYVQEQVITTLAMVADASVDTFVKHYSSMMPLLLNVLNNANGPDHKKLRVKAMECAGLIGVSSLRLPLLIRTIRPRLDALTDPGDAMLSHYLIATWAKVCQAMGSEFEPFLPAVMSQLLRAASVKADVSIYEDENVPEDKEGWETITMDGKQVVVRTSAIDEKCRAFETLVIYMPTLGTQFALYLSQTLELVLPSLRFYLHDGVREACAILSMFHLGHILPSREFTRAWYQLHVIDRIEPDASFLSSPYKSLSDTLRVLGGPPSRVKENAEQASGTCTVKQHNTNVQRHTQHKESREQTGDGDVCMFVLGNGIAITKSRQTFKHDNLYSHSDRSTSAMKSSACSPSLRPLFTVAYTARTHA